MRVRLDDCSPQLKKRIEDAIRTQDYTSHPVADVESHPRNAPLATSQTPYFTTRVDIHVHSIRKRLADPDGIAFKYCLDAIVRAGILKNDTAQEIRQVTFSQEKGKQEQTVITILKLNENE